MDYPKSVPGVGLANGKFVDEDIVTGTPGSLIPAEWGNAVTDELLAVIRAAQINPKEDDLDQLLEAIRYIVQNDAYAKGRVYNKEEMDALLKNNNGVPIGMMVPFPVSAIPPGFLEVDGSLQSIAAYPDLAAYLGTRFNQAGDPAGYFRLPESRGEFLRGWDHGRGVDAGRTVGSSQLDAFQNITGVIGLRGGTSSGIGVLDGATGAFSTSFGWGGVANTVSRDASTSNRGDTVFFDASTVARTSTETRPRNLAVMWCIKAWNAPVNQGSIDIAALSLAVKNATPMVSGQQIFSASGTFDFVVPQDVKASSIFEVEVWGGGGGGGSYPGSGPSGGGGGGGGYSYRRLTGLVAGSIIKVTVGVGGGPGTTVKAYGQPGGTSSFGDYLSATGGRGGASVTTQVGGVIGGSGIGGDMNMGGDCGCNGTVGVGGSGGMAARGGGGGLGGFSGNGIGMAGLAPGGGGGGGDGATATANPSGGTGAFGMVIVKWR